VSSASSDEQAIAVTPMMVTASHLTVPSAPGHPSNRRPAGYGWPTRKGWALADFIRYELEDGGHVYFETDEASLVSHRSGEPSVVEAGKLSDRLHQIAQAAGEVSNGLRQRLQPESIELEFGVKISGEVNWWFISRAKGEGSMTVRVSWTAPSGQASSSGAPIKS
jgi:hypothetical protein